MALAPNYYENQYKDLSVEELENNYNDIKKI